MTKLEIFKHHALMFFLEGVLLVLTMVATALPVIFVGGILFIATRYSP